MLLTSLNVVGAVYVLLSEIVGWLKCPSLLPLASKKSVILHHVSFWMYMPSNFNTEFIEPRSWPSVFICGSVHLFRHCQWWLSNKVLKNHNAKSLRVFLTLQAPPLFLTILFPQSEVFELPLTGAGTSIRFADVRLPSLILLTARAAPAPSVCFGLLWAALQPIWFSSVLVLELQALPSACSTIAVK